MDYGWGFYERAQNVGGVRTCGRALVQGPQRAARWGHHTPRRKDKEHLMCTGRGGGGGVGPARVASDGWVWTYTRGKSMEEIHELGGGLCARVRNRALLVTAHHCLFMTFTTSS